MTQSYDAATVQRLVDAGVKLECSAEDTGVFLEYDPNVNRYMVWATGDVVKVEHESPDFPAAWAAWLAACGLDAERPEFQPDWNNAPEEAEFWAMDANDKQHWYEKEPRIHEIFEILWTAPGLLWPDHTDYGDAIADVYWRKSLRRRLEVTP